MRFIFVAIHIVIASAFLRMDSSEDGFDPKTQLEHLVERTKEAKSSFENESLQIDSLLQRVVGKKPLTSLVELKSASALESERKAFENRKAALIEKDGKELAQRQREFAQAMQKLRKDTAAFVKREGMPAASFLEVKSKYSDGNLDQYYEDSHRLVDQVRSLAHSVHSQSEAIISGVHKKITELQSSHVNDNAQPLI